MKVFGVDVSKYKGRPDWQRAVYSGCKFAILRAVSGAKSCYIDESFSYNYDSCKKVGLPVGIYLASYLDLDREMYLLDKCLKGRRFEYPIFYDIEDFSFRKRNPNKKEATEKALKFCQELEGLGYYVGVYSNKYFMENYLDRKKLYPYDSWIAHWNKGADYSKTHGLHQYTNKARVPGIPSTSEGGVDGNIAYKDYPKIMRENGLNGYEEKASSKEGQKKDQRIDFAIYSNNSADQASVDRALSLLKERAIKVSGPIEERANFKYLVQIGGKKEANTDIFISGKDRYETDRLVTEWLKEQIKI